MNDGGGYLKKLCIAAPNPIQNGFRMAKAMEA